MMFSSSYPHFVLVFTNLAMTGSAPALSSKDLTKFYFVLFYNTLVAVAVSNSIHFLWKFTTKLV